MRVQNLFLIFLALCPSAVLRAQQAATSQSSPQPPQVQAQPAPCTAKPAPPRSAGGVHFRLPPKIQQALDKQRAEIGNKTGISVPQLSPDQIANQAATPHPCPTGTSVASAPSAAPTAPVPAKAAELKLPPDTSVTLHCNPLTPSSKGVNGAQTALTLPDPHDFALPKANQFEADSVVPDLAAKTPCYLVKVDPKTGKSFIAQ